MHVFGMGIVVLGVTGVKTVGWARLADHRRVPSRVGYRCTRSAEFQSIRIAASSVMDKP
jgi:hypothetical protein